LDRGWMGPRAVLDAAVKRKIPSPRRESNPRTPKSESSAEVKNACSYTSSPQRPSWHGT